MKKILCIGECCCDIIFGGLPKVPELGQEVYCRDFAIKTGGAANTPMMLSRLGAPVRFLTGIGEDAFGKMIRKELEDGGVAIADVELEKGYRTAVSAVLSTQKDRCFASYAGSDGFAFSEEQLREEICGADIVHTFLGYCLRYPIARLCAEYGKELSLDDSFCGPRDERTEDIIKQCSYLKFNEEEARARTGKEDIVEAARDLSRMIEKSASKARAAAIITLGKEGSLAVIDGKIHHQPIIRMGEFLDACGAGDAYAAGFLAGISRNLDIKDGMKLGAAASGLCVTWYGGMEASMDPELIWNRFYEQE